MIEEVRHERTLEDMLEDCELAKKHAQAELGRAGNRKGDAIREIAQWRTRRDELKERIEDLKARISLRAFRLGELAQELAASPCGADQEIGIGTVREMASRVPAILENDQTDPVMPTSKLEEGASGAVPVESEACIWCGSYLHDPWKCTSMARQNAMREAQEQTAAAAAADAPAEEELPTVQPPAPSTAAQVSDDDIPW